MKRDTLALIVLGAMLAAALVWQSGGVPSFRRPEVVAPDASKALVVIVHDGDGVPDSAEKAANDLRSSGRQVRIVPVFAKSGSGQPPAEVAPAIESSKATGLPSLALLRGGKVVKAIKLPATTDAIMEAVK